MKILFISDGYRGWNPLGELGIEGVETQSAVPKEQVPSLSDLRTADYIYLFGQLESHEAGGQLRGGLQVALEQGAVVVFAFPVRLDGPDHQMFLELTGITGQSLPSGQQVHAESDLFHEYLTAYGGAAATFFPDDPPGREVLGSINHGDQRDACAIRVARYEGAVYAVPYRVADFRSSHAPATHALREAVEGLEADVQPSLAPFLSDLRLHGEQELRDEIASVEQTQEERRSKAAELARFRQLVGHASGNAFEGLVIDALNVVFEATDAGAVDREDVGREDFWVVKGEEDFALAEAKGIGTHIRRPDVSQVDNHRSLLDREPEDLPGLLVINIFRGSDDLEKRQLPVSSDVVKQGKRLNVLILRGWDLYQLVSLALAEEPGNEEIGSRLIKMLEQGGGWAEVDGSNITLRTE
jgi:hypothetical protein